MNPPLNPLNSILIHPCLICLSTWKFTCCDSSWLLGSLMITPSVIPSGGKQAVLASPWPPVGEDAKDRATIQCNKSDRIGTYRWNMKHDATWCSNTNMEDQARPGLCDEFLYEKGIDLSPDIRFDMFGSTVCLCLSKLFFPWSWNMLSYRMTSKAESTKSDKMRQAATRRRVRGLGSYGKVLFRLLTWLGRSTLDAGRIWTSFCVPSSGATSGSSLTPQHFELKISQDHCKRNKRNARNVRQCTTYYRAVDGKSAV